MITKAWLERDLVLLLDYRGALRQRAQEYESIDVAGLTARLAAAGWRVDTHAFEDVANGLAEPRGRLVHYTSTQDPRYRGYVDDVLLELDRDNELIPRYELFRAHEDKVYQELLRRRLGLSPLGARLFGNLAGLDGRLQGQTFPAVLKTAAGFQSTGVSLAGDAEELTRRVRRLNRPRGLPVYRLKQWLKRHVLQGRYRPEQYRDCIHAGPFVVQEFVPGASGDWKVLVFDDRFYVLRRGVRPGDFRASGSGRFSYETPPDPVLDLAADTARRLDAPLVSLDLVEGPQGVRLIEFQALHFGTYTLDQAPCHFRRGDTAWERIDGPADLDEEYARALLQWLERRRTEATA